MKPAELAALAAAKPLSFKLPKLKLTKAQAKVMPVGAVLAPRTFWAAA